MLHSIVTESSKENVTETRFFFAFNCQERWFLCQDMANSFSIHQFHTILCIGLMLSFHQGPIIHRIGLKGSFNLWIAKILGWSETMLHRISALFNSCLIMYALLCESKWHWTIRPNDERDTKRRSHRIYLCILVSSLQALGANKLLRKSSCKQPLMNSSFVNDRSPFKSSLFMIFSTRFVGEFSPLRFSSPSKS